MAARPFSPLVRRETGSRGSAAPLQARIPWPLPLLFLTALLILAFGILADEMTEGSTGTFDQIVLSTVHGPLDAGLAAGPGWLREAGRDVTALGSTTVLAFITLAAAGFLLLDRQWLLASMMACSVGGGQAMSSTLKVLFHRARPELPGSPEVFTASFPSGHALMSAVVYLTLAAILARLRPEGWIRLYLSALAVILVVAIGASRVYLGVHYPTDVLAGWIVGAAWSILAWQLASFAVGRVGQGRGAAGKPEP